MPKIQDYSGKQFNKLTVIKYTGKSTKHRGRIWLFHCECGNKEFEYTIKDVIKSRIKCCNKCANKQYFGVDAISYNIWKNSYADGDITFNDWQILSQQNCYYCDAPPSATRKGKTKILLYFTYNGLDRLDNNKGHTLDNVVTSCFWCNDWKSNIPVGDFFTHIQKIYQTRCII